jgi:hypothetical protein
MSNLLNLSDSINFAWRSGKTPTFIYNGTTYEFSPQGLIDFLTAEGGFGASGDISVDSVTVATDAVVIDENGVLGDVDAINLDAGSGTLIVGSGGSIVATGLPTADPSSAGQLWNDAGTLKISAG